MASLFKSFFGGGELEELPEELRKLLAQAKRDKKSLRDLAKRLETASSKVEADAKPLEEVRGAIHDIGAQLAEVRGQADSLGGLSSQIEALERRAEELTQTIEQASRSIGDASQRTSDLTERVDDLSGFTAEVSTAREALEEMPIEKTRAAMQDIAAQVDQLQSSAATLTGLASEVGELEQRADSAAHTAEQSSKAVEEVSRQIRDLNETMEGLSGLVQNVSSAREELAAVAAPSGVVATIRQDVEQLQAQLADGEKRGGALKEMLFKVDVVGTRTKEMTELQLDLAKSIERISRTAGNLEGQVVKLRSPVEAVAEAKKAVRELTGPKGAVATLRAEIDRLEERLSNTETRAKKLSELEAVVDSVAQRSGEFSEAEGKITASLEDGAQRVRELDDKVGEIRELLGSVAIARQEMNELAGATGTVSKLRSQTVELRQQFLEYSQDTAQVREDQSGLRQSQEEVISRYDSTRAQVEKLTESVDGAATRIATVEDTMRDLSQADELSIRTERHLNALKALSDHVTRKMAALELQGEMVDRTEMQARNVANLQIELQAKLQQASVQVKEIKKVHGNIDSLRALNSEVADRTAGVRADQARIQKENEALRTLVSRLHEEARRSVTRFQHESRGLETVSQRIIDLRAGLTDFESRFHTLDGSVHRINETADRADHLSVQLTTLTSGITQLSEQAEHVEGMRGGIERAESSAIEIAQRLERLEALQEDVSEAVRDLNTLRRSREEVRDSLEQVRGSRAEIERLQLGQTETNAWLSTVQDSIRDVRAKVSTLDELAAGVDYMRRNADRVLSAANNLEARGGTMEAMDGRVTELIQLGTQLEERTRNLLGNLTDADHRFQAVVSRAGEADDLRRIISTVAGEVRQVERKIVQIDESVDSVGGRAEAIEGLSKRVDRIGAEIDMRQQALAAATENLSGVTVLRRESAEAAQALEIQVRTLTADLRAAEAQVPKVVEHAERLEARAGSLRFVDKRLTQFEEKLAHLDSVEQELGRSLQSLTERQETIDAVRSDLKELFETAEQALESVRATAAARDEVREAHETLNVVREKADEMTRVLTDIDKRQSQIEEAEKRLARAEALLMDIRGGIDTLRGQKVVVDHVIETTGKLNYQAKEAEGLIATLRQEREITQRIQEALKEMRDEEAQAS